ncbi:flagellar filament capping protein FliD [Chitinivorax sp. B]|uniref:flagellar filament capping protein FliD n=1 Tax=Chitinivorax sp. B TaxID=2502235 RepID=UPI0010F9AF48|nr:flagellar filament capping protein FliD [Chitinivorax sp. B]
MIGSIYSSSIAGLYTSRGLLQPSDYLRDSEISRIGGRGVGLSAAGNDLSRAVESTQVRLSNVGKLRSALDTFRTDLDTLSTKDKVSPFKALSSDEAVARATAALPDDLRDNPAVQLVVSQVATSQTLQSESLDDANSTIAGTGSLTIQTGSFSDANGTFTPTTEPPVTINISAADGTLNGIARSINNANAGISARVVEGSDGFRLEVTASSGTSNTLRITAQDNDGTNTDTSGLSRFAFDPTASTGNGQNLDQTVVARNTEVTLDDRRLSSANNTVTDVVNGVRLDIQGTGSTNITIGRDQDAFRQAAKRFADSINAFEQSISEQREERLTARTLSQVTARLNAAESGFGLNRQTLADIGISRDTKGRLSVDEDRLATAFNRNPDNASQLLSQSASTLRDDISLITAPQSELRQTGQILERTLSSLETRRNVQQLSNTQMYYGLPAQQASSLFNYVPRQGSPLGAARYLSIANSA